MLDQILYNHSLARNICYAALTILRDSLCLLPFRHFLLLTFICSLQHFVLKNPQFFLSLEWGTKFHGRTVDRHVTERHKCTELISSCEADYYRQRTLFGLFWHAARQKLLPHCKAQTQNSKFNWRSVFNLPITLVRQQTWKRPTNDLL